MEGTVVQIRDKHGEGFDVLEYEDLVMPVLFQRMGPSARLNAIKEFKHQEGDVLICSYPKSGTRWLYNLVHFLMFPGPVDSMPTLTPRQLELSSLVDIEMLPAPRLLSSHLKPNRLPTEHMQKNGKVIILARNPKDTLVSCLYHLQKNEYFNYSKLSWKQFFECWVSGKIPVGSFFDYFNSWQQEITGNHDMNVLIVFYENLVKDGVNELKRLQQFLGTENTDVRLQRILDRCTPSSLKFTKEEQKAEPMLQDEYAKKILYRKGDVGNWRHHFTVAQNEYFDKLLEDNFKESMFKFQYD